MKQTHFPTLLGLLILVALSLTVRSTDADDPIVFVSAFEPGERGGIQAYRFDLKTGNLAALHRTGEIEHPFFLALAPDGKHLYSIHARNFGGKEPEEIAALELEGRTGKLRLLNRQSARGTAACYLQVDASGKTLVVANYSSGSVASLPIQPDGSLAPAASFFQHRGSSIDRSRQSEAHAHCFVIGPHNHLAFAADLGLDQVLIYQLLPDAKLGQHTQPFVRTLPGAGPRHLTFHPNGKSMYVINELANSVTHFHYDPVVGFLSERQTVSTLPPDFDGTSYCADLKITPDGRFLYGTNRGHDSIAAYRIDAEGQLELIAIEPSRGKGPQNLAITPGGKWLICANMPGNNLSVFGIDPASGTLKIAGDTTALPSPSCIQILP